MSLDLIDLPTKIHPEAHAYLKALSEIQHVHINELARKILHDYVLQQIAIHIRADDYCKSKGLPGISGDFK